MKIKHSKDFENIDVDTEGFKGFRAHFCLTKGDGCENFALRMLEFAPHGHTSFHSHPEEHEVYFLEGDPCYVDADGIEHVLKPGDAVYVEPNEKHQFKNLGNTVMKMICVIPILPDGEGKETVDKIYS